MRIGMVRRRCIPLSFLSGLLAVHVYNHRQPAIDNFTLLHRPGGRLARSNDIEDMTVILKLFPSLIMILQIISSLNYAADMEWKHAIFWAASAVITASVTY